MKKQTEIIVYAVSMTLKAALLAAAWVLKKVPVVRGYRHLTRLCMSFTKWYNNWRAHEFLGSGTPAIVFRDKTVPIVPKTAKVIPAAVEIKRFRETRVTAYGIKKAA